MGHILWIKLDVIPSQTTWFWWKYREEQKLYFCPNTFYIIVLLGVANQLYELMSLWQNFLTVTKIQNMDIQGPGTMRPKVVQVVVLFLRTEPLFHSKKWSQQSRLSLQTLISRTTDKSFIIILHPFDAADYIAGLNSWGGCNTGIIKSSEEYKLYREFSC